MPSVNEAIRDKIVEHTVDVMRTAAGLAGIIDREMTELGEDLAALVQKIDPTAPAASRFQERRRKILQEKAEKLIRERMIKIRRMMNEELKEISETEAIAAAEDLKQALSDG